MKNVIDEVVDESIINFLTITTPNEKANVILKILLVLDNIGIYDELEPVLIDLISSDTEDTEMVIYKFNLAVMDAAIEKIESYGILLLKDVITFTNIHNLLYTLKEVVIYNVLNYDVVTNILSNDTEDEILKLGMLIEYFTVEPMSAVLEYVDDIDVNLFIELEKHLEEVKEREITDVDNDFIIKIIEIDKSLLSTTVVKHILDNKDDDFIFDDYKGVVYDTISAYTFDISKSALEIYALITLANDIENINYLLDSEVLDDLTELGIEENIAKKIIEQVKLKV